MSVRASLEVQLSKRALVCPITKQVLVREGAVLRSDARSYPIVGEVPFLLADATEAKPSAMEAEYRAPPGRLDWLKDWLRREDYRTKSSLAACARVLSVPDGSLCLSIGGGPLRIDEKLVNLNIDSFRNVDVVGDAHRLPYADASVDAVHCEAVFEHLHSPTVAACEMARVLKPGALAFVCTPFLQAFHGYPSHFQNFTIFGHRKLFEDAGLEIVESGVCNGPAMAMIQMWRVFGDLFVPRVLRPLTRAAYVLGRVAVAPLDRILGERENAYVLASTTYLVARKA